MQTLNLGAEGAGVHSFNWPSGAATSGSGLTFRVTATAGGVATTATPLMRDRVDAISTTRHQLQPRARELGHGSVQRRQGLQLDPSRGREAGPQKANTPWASSKVFPV